MWGKRCPVCWGKIVLSHEDGYLGNLVKLRGRSAVDGFRRGWVGVAHDGSLTYPRAPAAVTI